MYKQLRVHRSRIVVVLLVLCNLSAVASDVISMSFEKLIIDANKEIASIDRSNNCDKAKAYTNIHNDIVRKIKREELIDVDRNKLDEITMAYCYLDSMTDCLRRASTLLCCSQGEKRSSRLLAMISIQHAQEIKDLLDDKINKFR